MVKSKDTENKFIDLICAHLTTGEDRKYFFEEKPHPEGDRTYSQNDRPLKIFLLNIGIILVTDDKKYIAYFSSRVVKLKNPQIWGGHLSLNKNSSLGERGIYTLLNIESVARNNYLPMVAEFIKKQFELIWFKIEIKMPDKLIKI